MANPYHDPKTGKFASKSGLNRDNSTLSQRGKAKVKEHISAGKAAIGAAGIAVAGAVGAAILQGISRPIRYKGAEISHKAVHFAEKKANELIAAHGPRIAAAIHAKGSTLLNHVKNMKSAGATQHSSASSISSSVKPRVRVQAGSAPMSKPKIRVPAGRK